MSKKGDEHTRSESVMHHKEHQQLFYKKLGAVISNLDQVLLFGSANAKIDLSNYFLKDLYFKVIKFNI